MVVLPENTLENLRQCVENFEYERPRKRLDALSRPVELLRPHDLRWANVVDVVFLSADAPAADAGRREDGQ